MCSQPACLCTNSSIELSALPFLFCCVVNTDGRIPEINPALGRPATTLCNVITQTQQFMASTTRNKKKKNIIWRESRMCLLAQKGKIWKYCNEKKAKKKRHKHQKYSTRRKRCQDLTLQTHNRSLAARVTELIEMFQWTGGTERVRPIT